MTEEPLRCDALINCVIVGDMGCGKTSFICRFANGTYSHTSVSTIGVENYSRAFRFRDRAFNIQLWDTSGQERFSTFTSSYFRSAHVIFHAYAIDDRASYDHVRRWIEVVNEKASEHAMRILVGMKRDAADNGGRKVLSTVADEFARAHGMNFFETSAAYDTNIIEVFNVIAQWMYEELDMEPLEQVDSSTEQTLALQGVRVRPRRERRLFNGQRRDPVVLASAAHTRTVELAEAAAAGNDAASQGAGCAC